MYGPMERSFERKILINTYGIFSQSILNLTRFRLESFRGHSNIMGEGFHNFFCNLFTMGVNYLLRVGFV